MDQHYKSAASKLKEIFKQHKRGLSKEETYMSALIKELKDGVPGKIDVEAKFKVLENALKKNHPGIWTQIEEIRNSLATALTGTVRTETSTAAPEPKARALGDTEIGILAESFRVIIAILETNRATEPFPEPDAGQKEKLGECYEYALKVANLCKERERNLEHAYKIIGDLHNQVMECDVDQAQERSHKPTNTRIKKEGEGTDSTVPKKTEHNRASELEKKGRTASPALKKKDTTSSSMKVNQEKNNIVPTKTEPNIAQEIEMKSIAVSSAIRKMKDTKGYLEGASKVIQELYSQVMEVNDDHAQEKPETLITTSSMKVTEDTGHTDPTETEPDIAKELEIKGTAVAAALKKMKDTKVDLERASKIIEDLHIQVMEDTVNQEQAKPEKPTTTEPKKGDDNTGHQIPPKTVPHMAPKLEKRGTARLPSITKTKDTTTSSKKVTQENEHTVPKTTEPTIANELEMKGYAVSFILQKMKDTKGDLERASKIIQDLYNQVKDVTDDQEKTEPLMTTSSKTGSNDTGQTTPQKTESDIGKELEMKGAAVSEALRNMKDTKGEMRLENQYLQMILENLHRNVIVGEATSHKELKQPEGLMIHQTLTELSTKTQKVTHKFYELETELEYVHGRISQLCSMMVEHEGSEVQVRAPERTNKFTAMGRKPRSNSAQATPLTERSLKLDKSLELLSSTLIKMKEKESDLEHAYKINGDIHNQVMEVDVDQAQERSDKPTTTRFKKESEGTGSTVPKKTEHDRASELDKKGRTASPGLKKTHATNSSMKVHQEKGHVVQNKIEPNIAQEIEMKSIAVSSAIKKMKDTKGEAEYAACLLEELSNFSHATNKDNNGNILSPPQSVETSQDFKEKEAKNVENSRQNTPQCSHDENLMKSYRYASHVLRDMKESERLRIDLGKKKDHIEDLMERLKNIQDENTKLMKEADSLRTRLSEHAGALLHHDNPAVADLSDPNRATKLGEKYLELYDNQWTDAFSKLQTEYSSASDEELTGYLYKLLVDGYAFCTDARHAQRFNLQEIMLNPTGDVTKSQIRPKEEVSKSFSNLLIDAAKLSSNVASGNIAKAFVKNEGTKIKHGKMIKLCKTYIQECVQLCWYMQVQTPPLCLDLSTTKGHAFEKNAYKEYTTRGKKIAFVVWPALFLHANGPLLSKGVAQGDLTPKQAAEV